VQARTFRKIPVDLWPPKTATNAKDRNALNVSGPVEHLSTNGLCTVEHELILFTHTSSAIGPKTKSFSRGENMKGRAGLLIVTQEIKLDPLSITIISARISSLLGCLSSNFYLHQQSFLRCLTFNWSITLNLNLLHCYL
jgi:hypothetical protein